MNLSIIIVNFNTRDLLRNCLTSIFNQKGVEYEVWVVDNASRDNSIQMVKNDFPKVKLIKNSQNIGFAKGNNVALRQAQGEYLFLLNSDTILKEETLSRICGFLKSNPEVGILGIKILNPDGSPQTSVGKFYNLGNAFLMLFGGEKLGFLRDSPNKVTEVDWVAGAALIVRREVLEKAGFLDENLFMYMEEVEWCFRVKKTGFRVFFYPEAEVVHYVRASGSKTAAILGIYKGLTYFYRKHKPLWELLVLRGMLKTKAGIAWMIGFLSNNRYLKTTYSEAFHLA